MGSQLSRSHGSSDSYTAGMPDLGDRTLECGSLSAGKTQDLYEVQGCLGWKPRLGDQMELWNIEEFEPVYCWLYMSNLELVR